MEETKTEEDFRKLQNRIAQRDFRKRKNRHLKDLEARVALHDSGDSEVIKLRAGIRALLEENDQLRGLLVKLSSFVGAGLGGELVKSGIDITDFKNLLAREKTDIVHDALAELNINSNPPNRNPNPLNTTPPVQRFDASTSNLTYVPPSNLSNPNHVPIQVNREEFEMRTSQLESPSSRSSHSEPSSASASTPTLSSATTTTTTTTTMKDLDFKWNREYVAKIATDELGGGEGGGKGIEIEAEEFFSNPSSNAKIEAIQLISYHMKNKHINPNYHLPPALRATIIQETIPHSTLLDGIIIPSLRDRLILSQDQFDPQILMADLIQAFTIHSTVSDTLVASNWEISEKWLKKYWYCISSETLDLTNRWRIFRGEKSLSINDLLPNS